MKATGRTRTAVNVRRCVLTSKGNRAKKKGKATRRGCPVGVRGLTMEQRAEVLRRAENEYVPRIARRFGVSRQAIYVYLKNNGIVPKRKRIPRPP